MKKVLIKICGIRTSELAQAAASAGADFLGLNFVPGFRRRITVAQAKKIIISLDIAKRPKLVGVFMNQNLDQVKAIAVQLGLDYIQLHGSEPPEYVRQLSFPVIKAFSLKPNFNVKEIIKQMRMYQAKFYLVDKTKFLSKSEFLQANNSSVSDTMLYFRKVQKIAKHFHVMLAGGLTPENVTDAVRLAQPFAVDVARGVEVAGQTSVSKIREFIFRARQA